MGDLQNGGQLQRIRLRAVPQDPSVPGTAATTTKSSAAPVAPAAEGDAQLASSSLVASQAIAPTVVPGIEVAPNSSKVTFRSSNRTTSMVPFAIAEKSRRHLAVFPSGRSWR